jgi:hypothetical protein
VYKSVFILSCSIIVKTFKNSNLSVDYRKSTWLRGCIEFATLWKSLSESKPSLHKPHTSSKNLK